MEAETDGMKSAALWRGSPGAKILLSHIPTNPTRRLGSLSHHSKYPHSSLHPPPPPTVAPLVQPSLWPLCITFLLFYSHVRIDSHICIFAVGHGDLYRPGKISSSRGADKKRGQVHNEEMRPCCHCSIKTLFCKHWCKS